MLFLCYNSGMWEKFKEKMYFVGAHYFAFWAKIILKKWRPKIILVTGSAGKTTLFCLLEAQMKEKADFAYHANSAYGVPFDILGLKRESFSLTEWIKLFLLAPWKVFKKNERKELYIVEADADRPGEGEFIAKLLKPAWVLITNVHQTHALRYDKEVEKGKYQVVIEAIADEFAQFAKYAKEAILINGDCQVLVQAVEKLQLNDEVTNKTFFLQEADYLNEYNLNTNGSVFVINKQRYELPYLLPREVALSLAMVQIVVKEHAIRLDLSYKNLSLPSGRSTLFKGIKNTTLIDSSYNANYGSMKAILDLFDAYPVNANKWLVLGQMLEQGREARKEHEKIASLVSNMKTIDRIFLVGENNEKWVKPLLLRFRDEQQVSFFQEPSELLETIKQELRGGEVILLKGAPMMEGMVEGLLADETQAKLLVRREEVFEKQRREIYGPKKS